MPPHCDSMDGPVAKAAIRALEEQNVDLILPCVHEPGRRRCADPGHPRSP
jgi:hypothetical protein